MRLKPDIAGEFRPQFLPMDVQLHVVAHLLQDFFKGIFPQRGSILGRTVEIKLRSVRDGK